MRKLPASIERWFFYQGMENLWKWARLDMFGTVLSSGSPFGSREDSVADARRNGYREDRLVSEAPAEQCPSDVLIASGAATRGDKTPGSETPENPSR